jgi:hypothetical protein
MCIFNTTLQATPCQLLFGRDMIHNIDFRANWERKQDILNKLNQKENKSQIPYEYSKVVDQMFSETPGIFNNLYRTISCNECMQDWYYQNA